MRTARCSLTERLCVIARVMRSTRLRAELRHWLRRKGLGPDLKRK